MSTDSHSHRAHGLAESHVRLCVPPVSVHDTAPEPTRNWKSTLVAEGPAETCMNPSSWRFGSWKSVPWNGLPTQLPVEGFRVAEVTTVRPGLHKRAALTPKNVPADRST